MFEFNIYYLIILSRDCFFFIYLDAVGGVADLLGSGSGGVGRCVGVCDLAGAGCGVIVTGVAVTDGDCVNECDECDVGEGLLCVAKRCSISCSC